EVILLSDVDHVGLRGDVVSVARGYARNYLLPRRLAEEATPARVSELQKRDVLRARHEAKTADQAQEIAEALSGTVLRFEVKAGVIPEGGALPSGEELAELEAAERAEQEAEAPEEFIELEEILAEVDAAEAAETEAAEAEAAEPDETAEAEAEADAEPEWRA